MTVTHNQLTRKPGELEAYKFRDDFWYDSATGFLASNSAETEFVTPSFDPGEIWELRFNIVFSQEPKTNDEFVIASLQNEAQDETIVRGSLDDGSGTHIELHATVTGEQVGFTGSQSPDLQLQSLDDYQANYFILGEGVRVRRPSDTSDRNDDGSGNLTADRVV